MYLEIWIRKGKYKYGSLKLSEQGTGKMRYEKSIHLYTSLKKWDYYGQVSLEYERHKSRWTFVAHCTPWFTQVHFLEWRYPEYFITDCHFETTGQSHMSHFAYKNSNMQLFELFLQWMIWSLLQRDGKKYQFILIIKVMKNHEIKEHKLLSIVNITQGLLHNMQSICE